MKSFYFISILGIYVLTGCNNPTISPPNHTISPEPQPQPIDPSTSTASKTTNKIKSILDQAQLTTGKISKDVDSALEQANKASKSASKAIEDITIIKTQLKKMSTHAGDTITAVDSGNFPMAQQKFTQVQRNWHKIKDPIKQFSPQAYQEVNTQLTTINSLLKQPDPNRTELTQQLSSFSDRNLSLLNIYSKAQKQD
ncbi:hypothetical protein [Gloeothece citriformis]|nr:hypothetical protein [Gloeothece citriformis]